MKQLKILNIRLLRVRSTKEKGWLQSPSTTHNKNLFDSHNESKYFFKKNYLIVHVKIEIIKKPQFKHMVYI